MSTSANVFFQAAEQGTTSISVNDASNYFLESLKLQDPSNLKSALQAILSICRGNMYLYGALASPQAIQFLQELLKFPDPLLSDRVAALLSGVMCRFPIKFTPQQVKTCADYPNSSEAGKMSVLANLLKNDAWRIELWNAYQMRILSGAGNTSSVPAAYKATFCLWLVSFSPDVQIPNSAVVGINELLKTCRAEKAVRIGLMALENMLKKKSLCEAMAENDTLTVVSSLEYEKWRDAELVDLILKVKNQLQQEVKTLTNFERFEREVSSGKLKNGFIHSEKFWVENVLKCEANNFRVVDHLMVIVRTARDPETLSVACHDLGEFARLHPVGKHVLTSRGAKTKMLELMQNNQRDVAREALLCVQKLMLQKPLQAVAATA